MLAKRPLAALLILTASLLAGCAGREQMGTPSANMAIWAKSTSMGERIGQIAGDAKRVSDLHAHPRSALTLRTVCAVLLVDVQSSNGDLPSPNEQVSNLLSSAYEHFSKAGLACSDEATAGKTSPSAKTLAYLGVGNIALRRALSQAEVITGAVIATTTTTVVPLP
jgi:hypothetical protein